MIRYPIASNTIGAEEVDAARRVLDSGNLTMGAEVLAFEREFAEFVGVRNAIMVNSGSSANLIAVACMMVRSSGDAPWRSGDEVIVPALSWPTTVWPIAQLGLVPVFVDVDAETLAIDTVECEDSITATTRGAFLIHSLGRAGIPFWVHGLRSALLEDACESLGAIDSSGRHVGTAGTMGTFSFYFSHHVSTIEGGMVVTSDDAIADDLRSLRAHGWTRERGDRAEWAARHPEFDDRFLFILPGYNVRPTEIGAAIGRVQLRRLPKMLEERRALAKHVRALLPEWLEMIGADAPEESHSWMMLPFRVTDAARSVGRVKACLERHGVECRPVIAGNLARHPAVAHIKHRRAESLAVCDALLDRGFMIGCHPVLRDGALGTLEKALESLRRM